MRELEVSSTAKLASVTSCSSRILNSLGSWLSSKQTSKWSDVNSEEYSTALNQYYNSLGLDDKGNVYYAALEGWGAQYKNNLTLIMDATKKTTILEKMGVNAFPAGFYTIPHKSKDKH